jgi:hypothetical protein
MNGCPVDFTYAVHTKDYITAKKLIHRKNSTATAFRFTRFSPLYPLLSAHNLNRFLTHSHLHHLYIYNSQPTTTMGKEKIHISLVVIGHVDAGKFRN